MSSLKDVERLANELLNTDFSIEVGFGQTYVLNAKDLGYRFEFDNSKNRFGVCRYTRKVIGLSRVICSLNLNQLNGKIKDTILHELAHAFCIDIYGVKNGRGHDSKWVSIAKQIGCDGKRCYSADDFGGINMPKGKYTLTCPTCSKESSMHRKPSRSYACGKCCSNGYDPKHKLVIVQNY